MNAFELQQLKDSIDLVALVRAAGVTLKKAGSDYVARCPFHEERKPSFRVTPAKNLFHCFGCGAGGSPIDFVMRRDNVDRNEAVRRLCDPNGELRRGARRIERPPPKLAPERVQSLLERVNRIYQDNLATEPEEPVGYLRKRGLGEDGLVRGNATGYANGKLAKLLPKPNANGNTDVWRELLALGIFLEDGRERFAGCVVFAVRDVNEGIVTLYGRNITESVHKNHLFLPNRPTGLWNVSALKQHTRIILVESILDALSIKAAGFENVIAIQGTNGLSDADIDVFVEHGVGQVVLLLDGDDSGKRAVTKLASRLSSKAVSSSAVWLPDGHDPNSYLVAHGPKALAEMISLAKPVQSDQPPPSPPSPSAKTAATAATPAIATAKGIEPLEEGFAVRLGGRRYEIHGLEKGPRKLKATLRIDHAGRLYVDTLDFYSARARRQLESELARVYDESAEVIQSEVMKLMSLCEAGEACTHGPSAGGNNGAAAMTAPARREAEAFGKDPRLIERILEDFERCGLVGERGNKLLCYIASVSRKMDKPLSVLILSSSGAGKTTLQDVTVAFCPPEDLVKLTSLSGKALFYKEQMSLKHKILALEEGDGMEEAGYALRNLISAGQLVVEATIKDPASGKLTTMENRVEGPTTVFLTTTDPESDPETKSRFFVTSVDESREQTQAILAYQRRRQTVSGLADQSELDRILEVHRNFQRLLKPVAVVNPYADQLTYGDDRLQGRRDQPKYLNLIKAVAFLRQLAKTAPPAGAPKAMGAGPASYIEIDREDVRLANELANEILGHSLDELSRPGYDLLMLLFGAHDKTGNATAKEKNPTALPRSFTRRDIREYTGWSNARVHRYLKELIELEYVVVESGRNGTLQTYRLLYNGEGKDGRKFLLGLRPVEELIDPICGAIAPLGAGSA